jgi:hypothetical protein
MADTASDFWRKPHVNPHTGEVDVVLGFEMHPTLTREQFNTVRAAAVATGYPGARDALDTIKPGIAPWIDLFTSHPTDPAKVAGIRARWVWVLTCQGDVPPLPGL